MDPNRKYAYRYLLYWAMLEIRLTRWPPRGMRRLNPFTWTRHMRNIRRCGQIAEWLHNMAAFSTRDFANFDEQRFWNEHDRFHTAYPDFGHYRSIFENALTQSQTGRWPSVEEQKKRDAERAIGTAATKAP